MKILPGIHVVNSDEAINLALETAGAGNLDHSALDVFEALAASSKVRAEVEKMTGSAIRNRYSGKATWRMDPWFVPVPRFRYDSQPVPQLTIEVAIYFVAAGKVSTAQASHPVTLLGLLGKPETLSIPMGFLHALLERDLGRFTVKARDSVHTTWEIPGGKPLQLPNAFIDKLRNIFRWQSVVSWLEGFGAQGRYVAPFVAGSLLGLAFQDKARQQPASRQGFSGEELVGALEGMAFRHAEAEDMVSRAMPRLRADMTLEEAIRIALQTSKGGERK